MTTSKEIWKEVWGGPLLGVLMFAMGIGYTTIPLLQIILPSPTLPTMFLGMILIISGIYIGTKRS